MARSVFKYYSFNNSEIINYIFFLTEYKKLINLESKRCTTITKLNDYLSFNIHTGKWIVLKRIQSNYWGFKLGQLTKTRKPFFFRSKKKR